MTSINIHADNKGIVTAVRELNNDCRYLKIIAGGTEVAIFVDSVDQINEMIVNIIDALNKLKEEAK